MQEGLTEAWEEVLVEVWAEAWEGVLVEVWVEVWEEVRVEVWEEVDGNTGGVSVLNPGRGRQGRKWQERIGGGANWWLMEGILLLLIAEKPSHGYELMHRLTDFGMHFQGVGQMGNVYRILSELEMLGFIRSSWNTFGVGPARKVYEITPEGKLHLKQISQSAATFKSTLDKFTKRCDEIE